MGRKDIRQYGLSLHLTPHSPALYIGEKGIHLPYIVLEGIKAAHGFIELLQILADSLE